MKVVVILPTYNERENIRPLLKKLIEVTQKIRHHSFTILVVDDTSPDGTADVVATYQKSHDNILLISGKMEGLGKALLRGMSYAADTLQAEIIVQIDADLSHDPAVLPKFLTAIDNGADFAVGSRYIPGGSIPSNWGIHRKIYSIVGNAVVRYGLGYTSVHDWTGGYRAYRRAFFEAARNELHAYRGYVFQIAFLHKSVKRHAKVVEVPIHFTDRLFGHSKIAPSEYIRDVIIYVATARLSGSFGKFLVVGTIGFIINTIVLEVLVSVGLHPTWGSVAGAELAIISNFLLNNSWTFRERKIEGKRRLKKFVQFNTTSAGAIIIQAGTIAIGTFFAGVGTYRVFYILGVGIALVWNYLMYSRVIWRRSS